MKNKGMHMRVSSELVKQDHYKPQSSSVPVENIRKVAWLSCSICALGAIFYFYEYYLRVAPSVMVAEISQHYAIQGVAFGNLAACYYYAYTPMQLPVGILMDKYGARRILTIACLLCALGTFLFIATDNLLLGQIGRFAVGFGSAFSFVGVLTLASNWLPAKYFAMFAGFSASLGMLGAISGATTLTYLVQEIGWRPTLFYAGVVGVLLTPILWWIIRDKPASAEEEVKDCNTEAVKPKQVHSFSNLWHVMKSRQMWLNGVIGAFMFLPIAAFAELWGVPFLKFARGFTAEQAAVGVSMIFFGYAVGGPLWGWLSDKVHRRVLPMMLGSLLATVALAAVIYMPTLSYYGLLALLFAVGACTSAKIIVFALGRDYNIHAMTGTAMAFTNMVIMLGGAIFQPAIGKMLDSVAGPVLVAGHLNYTAQEYSSAMAVLPVTLLIASIMICFLKETYCRQIED